MLGDYVLQAIEVCDIRELSELARDDFEKLQEAAKTKVCHIDGCINHDDAFENCCSRYVWVECCVDCTPYSERIRNEMVGD